MGTFKHDRGMKHSLSKLLTIFALYLLLGPTLQANSFSASPVLEIMPRSPVWGFDFLGEQDETMFFYLQDGRMGSHDFKTSKTTYFSSTPKVHNSGQGGGLDLLTLELDGQRWIYFSYSNLDSKTGENSTTLARAKLDSKNNPGKFETIYTAKPFVKSTLHFGSRIIFDQAKKHIFLSVGERNERDRAQDLSQDNGKVLRLNLDGSIPKDNPFVNTKNASPAIWSYGHRNPQGLARIPWSDEILEQEHGPRGGDEINWIQKGKNFGWPIITYGREYWGPSIGDKKKAGLEQPLYHYTPSIAPSGLMIYTGKKYKDLKGHIFSGALKGRHLNQLIPSKSLDELLVSSDKRTKFDFKEVKHLEKLGERIRNVRESPTGEIYISTDTGKVFKLTADQNSN